MTSIKRRWIRRFLKFVPVMLFVVGVSLMLYPYVSDRWHQSRAIAGYADAVSQEKREDLENMWKQARIYNMELKRKKNRYYLSEEDQIRYHQLLNLTGNGIMGYIEIPSIRCSLPIYHGTDESVLQVATGHIEGSSLPVGGAGSHCVISGHRGIFLICGCSIGRCSIRSMRSISCFRMTLENWRLTPKRIFARLLPVPLMG